MIDLAFDSSGDPFELPATAAFWRVRRFRRAGVRGGPEVVSATTGRRSSFRSIPTWSSSVIGISEGNACS